jgi:hypothetical protein
MRVRVVVGCARRGLGANRQRGVEFVFRRKDYEQHDSLAIVSTLGNRVRLLNPGDVTVGRVWSICGQCQNLLANAQPGAAPMCL